MPPKGRLVKILLCPHLSYSPNTVPSDVCLFPKVKITMKGKAQKDNHARTTKDNHSQERPSVTISESGRKDLPKCVESEQDFKMYSQKCVFSCIF